MVALSDLNQPYSCTQWGNVPNGGATQIINDTGYDIWELFNSQSAFPSTVWLNHEMQVYDMMNNAGSWSIGSRIDQMLEDCGSLCQDGGCSTAAGDVNEDESLTILDLITMVNHILGSSSLTDCALEAADMNADGIINIQDLITLVNAILGSSSSRSALNGKAEVEYVTSGNDMIIQINSDVDVAGIQLALLNDKQVDINLKDNSHINQDSHFQNGITKYLAYSMFNQPFDSRTTEILIKSAGDLKMDDIKVTVGDQNGDALYLSHSQSGQSDYSGPNQFQLSKLYPNPFNPSTQVSFSLPADEYVRLSAYDVGGREVAMIFEGAQSVGEHSYTWNASNLPSGVYYIRLQAGHLTISQKAILVK